MDKTGQDIVTMMLKQMGAVSVKTTPAKITIVKFEPAEDLKLTYVFEARKGEGTYLNRVSPYPMLLGQFFGEQDILEYIEKDIAKFERAKNGDEFDLFLAIQGDLVAINRQIEQLFLNRPTSLASLEQIDGELKRVGEALLGIEES